MHEISGWRNSDVVVAKLVTVVEIFSSATILLTLKLYSPCRSSSTKIIYLTENSKAALFLMCQVSCQL